MQLNIFMTINYKGMPMRSWLNGHALKNEQCQAGTGKVRDPCGSMATLAFAPYFCKASMKIV